MQRTNKKLSGCSTAKDARPDAIRRADRHEHAGRCDDRPMCEMNRRVLAAQRAQLLARDVTLDFGATHVGWKVALGIPGADRLIGQRPVFGYLTSATRF